MVVLSASELFIHTLCIQLNRITKVNKLKQGIFAQIPGKACIQISNSPRTKIQKPIILNALGFFGALRSIQFSESANVFSLCPFTLEIQK